MLDNPSMHLIIPYASSLSEGCASPRPGLKLPNLQQLLARLQAQAPDLGDAMRLSPPHERALAAALALPVHDGRTPWAALLAEQYPGLAQPGAGWGFVTLCHWQVSTNHMVMSPLPLPDLSATQSDELLAAMRPYFAEDGIALHADQTGRYLAQAPVLAGIDSASLNRVPTRARPTEGSRDTLHNSGAAAVVRIGMGCKAGFAANSRSYWQKNQRRRPPETVLPQTAMSCAECP